MTEQDLLAAQFSQDRPHLLMVAQRILGSAHEAEDAVQEAWVRLARTDTTDVGNLTGWLTTVVSRVCLDMLRSRASRREAPASLPLDLESPADPEHDALMADAIGPALLLVLETLAPAERLAFVLHDMFAVPFGEIAGIIGCTPVAARQLASRARRRVQGSPTPDDDVTRRRRVVDAFLAASRGGDFAALLEVLDPGVVLRADETAVSTGAAAMTTGADAVAKTFFGRAQAARPALIDGSPGLVWLLRGEPKVVFVFAIPATRVTEIKLVSDAPALAAMEIDFL